MYEENQQQTYLLGGFFVRVNEENTTTGLLQDFPKDSAAKL